MSFPKVLILAVTLAFACPVAAKTPEVGDKAPYFSAYTVDGKRVRLGDLRGDVVVVNFWATWCGPCKQELPLLNAFAFKEGQYGFHVLAVTVDDEDVRRSGMKNLQAVLSFPLLHHAAGDFEMINKSVPTNYVIGRDGVVRYAKAGAFSLDALNAVLVPLLNEPKPGEAAAPSSAASP